MSFFDFLYPTKCFLCRQITDGKGICADCEKKLAIAYSPSMRILSTRSGKIVCFSLYEYNHETVKKLIGYIKRHNDKKLYGFLAEKLSAALLKEPICADCMEITHVPRTKKSLTKHGFDQAALLAKQTVKSADGRKFMCYLKRERSSSEQKLLSLKERGENAKHMVRMARGNPPASLILIDDVITTGSTARACAEKLMEHGAKKVVCLFLAGTSRKS